MLKIDTKVRNLLFKIVKDLLHKVRKLDIKIRRIVDSSFAGEYRSAFRGQGLEFDEVVLLVSAQTGQQPAATSDQRRLQYVAITRAKKLATVIQVG